MELKIFFCYAQEDEVLVDKFRKHLEPMELSGIITTWRENDIRPGLEVDQEIRKQLVMADIILLLVGPDFTSSKYYGDELKGTIEQDHKGSVFLIILRPCDWETMFPKELLTKLRILPSDKKPITQSRNRDLALFDVVREIHRTIEELYSDVKLDVPAIPAGDKNSVKAVQKILSLSYRRAVFTPFDAEIDTQAMFKSLKDCRIALQRNIVYISSKEAQTVVSEIIGELDLIERLNGQAFINKLNREQYWERKRAINYAKLRIIKALTVLAKGIDMPFVLPTSFVRGHFWREEDYDIAPERAISAQQERLLQLWAAERPDDKSTS